MQWYSKTRNKIILLAPTLIFYLIYMIVPVLLAIGYSLTRYAGVGKPVLNDFKATPHRKLCAENVTAW